MRNHLYLDFKDQDQHHKQIHFLLRTLDYIQY